MKKNSKVGDVRIADSYDIVIVGASSSGAYFARKMADQGYSVLAIEKSSAEKLSTGYDIFHIAEADMKAHGLPMPQKGDGIWSFEFADMAHFSPYNHYEKPYQVKTIGLHKHPYMLMLCDWAKEAGATILFEAPFESAIVKGKAVKGVTFRYGGKQYSVKAKLVVDASGQPAVVRTSLPKKVGMETFKLSNKDVFFVRLRYIQFEERKRWMQNWVWIAYKMWLAPSNSEYDAILGIGSCLSFDQGEPYYEAFCKNVAPQLPPYEVCKVEDMPTPYKRSLYSYVGNGFLAVGGAGIVNRADNGEGVTEAMNHIDLAAERVGALLQKDKPLTRKNLWRINKKYNSCQGRDFAMLYAVMQKALMLSPDTMEYMFEKDCILSQSILAVLGLTLTPADLARQLIGLVKGLRSGAIPKDEFGPVGAGVLKAGAAIVLYTLYPPTPRGYQLWCRLADKLWTSVGQMADLYE